MALNVRSRHPAHAATQTGHSPEPMHAVLFPQVYVVYAAGHLDLPGFRIVGGTMMSSKA